LGINFQNENNSVSKKNKNRAVDISV